MTGTDSVASRSTADKDVSGRYYKKDYWRTENLKYASPHFRLQKAARILTKVAAGTELDLLDIGCGPATLMGLIPPNICYYGIDIAIRDPAPNLIEADFLEHPISFAGRKFDIAVAQGVFEYVGGFQSQKLAEIRALLKDNGLFLASYVNFGHCRKSVYWLYNNVQHIDDFRSSLSEFFTIRDSFPTSHNWNHSEPGRRFMRRAQLDLNVNVPLISSWLAVEYFFLCSPQ